MFGITLWVFVIIIIICLRKMDFNHICYLSIYKYFLNIFFNLVFIREREHTRMRAYTCM